MTWLSDTQKSYDALAAGYADETRDLLDRLPHVRAGVVLFADLVRAIGGGPVADVGCGPGHTTALLRELGADAFGIDLSPAMIEIARREHPGARFEVGSMTDLDVADGSLAGVIAWWSLIYIPDDAVPGVLGQFHRVLRPDGVLAVGFHVGSESKLETTGDGDQSIQTYVHHRQPSRVADWIREAGFTVEAQHLLSPDGPKPGAILFARRPADPPR
ncbi:class I SAM-dependent DNA methyltransferase [Actinomadura madurae]|uniref:class I SAM-dependent DNA methyltransferase n=1 Tax=Actinomadura madurae TaxID=1993 RepID=UPI0020272DD3|nr:methyltransferase domain-containing protein [Actinomadura madurae]MCQ0007345.1 class I SAM-dependent methyltransferase [Actinomadura madurae]URM97457.1 class I SAM-dependent methyltransferase [Actinomadura madurae]URN08149.1 class I SAM-dependent methyltransferase [Actinomadura madurae]